MPDCLIVYVTFPDHETAKNIADAVVRQRLAACANIFPAHQSLYWWDGAVQSEQEIAAIFKTTKHNYTELERVIEELHPYDVPCVVATAIAKGNKKFMEWIKNQANTST